MDFKTKLKYYMALLVAGFMYPAFHDDPRRRDWKEVKKLIRKDLEEFGELK